MTQPYCMVMTTTDHEQEANLLANLLVTEQLAACVQIMPINSVYHWQGEVRQDKEFLLLIKTKTELFEQVKAKLLQHHSYETPEIIQVPLTNGSADYLAWMDQQTTDQ